jgi:ATP-dependent DNA ligase
LERKFDGERSVARMHAGIVRLESGTAKDLTGTYPEVREAVAGQRDPELLLGGEVVALRWGADVVQPAPAAAGRHPSVWRAGGGVSRCLLRF